jgi:hypothetical protein
MITPNVQVYAIIQPDVMIWLEDKNWYYQLAG